MLYLLRRFACFVASFAEAWIEIIIALDRSAPLQVASFAEAWIEITKQKKTELALSGRLLRGGVD